MAVNIGIIHLPWTIKIIYGMISDNIQLFGTNRKSYIMLMGFTQFLALVMVWGMHDSNPELVTFLLTIANFSEAFVNVIADALLCIQARRDPVSGS